MSNSVMEKVQICNADQRRKRNGIVLCTAGICCLLLIVTALSRNTAPKEPAIQIYNPTTTTQADAMKATCVPTVTPSVTPSVQVLCATSNSEIHKVLKENVRVPYEAELRVRDVTGMTELERQEVLEEEKAYVKDRLGENPDENGCKRFCRDNVIVTLISEGELSIAFEDIETVDRIEVSVTENGYLFYPRISGIQYKKWDETGITVEVDGDRLRKGLEILETDNFSMNWTIAPSVADRFNEDPDMEMARISDRITIKIAYTDGSVETKTVVMQACDDGQMTILLLNGTIADQVPI